MSAGLSFAKIASKVHADRRAYLAQHGDPGPNIAPVIKFLISANQDEAGHGCAC
jgi:hypothetical protein